MPLIGRFSKEHQRKKEQRIPNAEWDSLRLELEHKSNELMESNKLIEEIKQEHEQFVRHKTKSATQNMDLQTERGRLEKLRTDVQRERDKLHREKQKFVKQKAEMEANHYVLMNKLEDQRKQMETEHFQLMELVQRERDHLRREQEEFMKQNIRRESERHALMNAVRREYHRLHVHAADMMKGKDEKQLKQMKPLKSLNSTKMASQIKYSAKQLELEELRKSAGIGSVRERAARYKRIAKKTRGDQAQYKSFSESHKPPHAAVRFADIKFKNY